MASPPSLPSSPASSKVLFHCAQAPEQRASSSHCLEHPLHLSRSSSQPREKELPPNLVCCVTCLLKSQFITPTEVHSRAREKGPDSSALLPAAMACHTVTGAELPDSGFGMAALRIIVAITFYQPSGAMARSPGPATWSLMAADRCGQREAPRDRSG